VIFVAVGTQAPFDRLVQAVDAWAQRSGRRDVFAQIGRDAWRPRHIEWVESLAPRAFSARVAAAEVVVAHAGMGTILTALELGKPVLAMPRRAALREHRNDHQVDTANKLAALGLVTVASDERELVERLDRLEELKAGHPARAGQLERLIETLRRFLETGAVPPRGGS
jgi:UDP-N-acetylglucosamine transferase subunit ALG13